MGALRFSIWSGSRKKLAPADPPDPLKEHIAKIRGRRSQVVLQVETKEQLARLPYERQGRKSVYTPPVIDERVALRRHPRIVEILELWWTTSLHTDPSGTKPSLDAQLGDEMSKAQYVLACRKLYRAMVQEWDEADCLAVSEEEWESDTDGATRPPCPRIEATLPAECAGCPRC